MSETTLSDKSRSPGIIVGAALAAILFLPQIYWLVKGYSNVQDWEMSLWGFYVSVLLAISYFYEHRSFLFRGIIWLFRYLHFPRGAGWALVYAGAFAILGGYYLLR